MAGADSSRKPSDPVKAALESFRTAWLSGRPVDLETFLAGHLECGPELRNEIEGFLLVAEGLPRVGKGPKASSRDEDAGEEIQHKILGDFKIIREIGRGGMATVYEAQQISLNRRVALKILPTHLRFSREAVKKFQREAEAGGRQSHPGIVAVHAVGEYGGHHYIAQELVEGGVTLADRIEEIQEWEELPQGYFRYVADFIMSVAGALHYAHESGVIHRDIKPSNILLTKDGLPKVTDFGLAKIEDALALSRTGDFSGTPYYMSPEQAASRRFGIDRRTDIFSLGVTLYEMLTQKLPFEGETSHEVIKKILLFDPDDPHKANPKVPRDLSAICLKAVEKVPDRRYQTMEEFAGDLNRFLQGDVILAKLAGPGTRIWKSVKRNPVVSTALAMAVLAVLSFIGYVLLWSYPQIRHERDIAEAEKEKALAAEKKAEEQASIAEERAQVIKENHEQIMRLSDVVRLSDLVMDADALWPAHPEYILDFEEWIERANTLLGRLDEHEQWLSSLRGAAISSGDDEPGMDQEDATEGPTWTFPDMETRWQHNTLAGLVAGLHELADEEEGLLKNVKERLAFAEMIKKKHNREHKRAWDPVIRSIANRDECPMYDGLDLEQQVGLVPIERDPESRLWEFAHLQTGEVPERGEDGKLMLTEETGLVFVLIPGGTFDMGAVLPSEDHPLGSPNVDPHAVSHEGPVHTVTVKPFFLSKYEMTQGQWLRFTGENPSTYHSKTYERSFNQRRKPHTLLLPVEMVSWKDCTRVLSRMKLRLPSEAEWEYAARAGTSTIWWTGNEEESLKGAANLCDTFCLKHFSSSLNHEKWLDDGHAVAAPVGSYRPNAFGLHDVCGNVWEWCKDVFGSYGTTPAEDSAYQVNDSTEQVIRGGCWLNIAEFVRSANRAGHNPGSSYNFVGLRPAASVQE